MNKKRFDCITFLNDAAEDTRTRLSGLSRQEQADYWRRRNKEVLAEQKKLVKDRGETQEYRFVARLEKLRKTRKTFDCVEMKNQAQQRIGKALEGRTAEEQAAYWAKDDALRGDKDPKHRAKAPD